MLTSVISISLIIRSFHSGSSSQTLVSESKNESEQCAARRFKLSHILNVTHGLNRPAPRCLCLRKLFVYPPRQIHMFAQNVSEASLPKMELFFFCLIILGFRSEENVFQIYFYSFVKSMIFFWSEKKIGCFT